jgi:general secretion pathway protein M
MIDHVSAWYVGLSLREKILVGVAAGMSAVLIAIYGLYLPLVSSIDEKRLEYRTALERRVGVEAMIASSEKKPASSSFAPIAGPIEQAISQRAVEAGFVLEKVEPTGNGRTSIAMAQARPSALLKWLAELEQQNIVVEAIEMKAANASTVSLSATLAGQP